MLENKRIRTKINGEKHVNKKSIENLVYHTNKEIGAWSAAKLRIWLEGSWFDNPKNFIIKSKLTMNGEERVSKLISDKYKR